MNPGKTKNLVEEPYSKTKIWLMAVRPKTLWAGISPVLIGTAMAVEAKQFNLLAAVLCLLGAITVQIGTNFANDYFDYVKGSDTEKRKGPTRVTQAGLIPPKTMKFAFMIAMGIVAFLGIILFFRAGWPVLVVAALSIISGILYTGGPFPYGYHGLGDVFVFVFFGPVAVGGTYFVQALELNSNVILAGIAPGLLSTAILTVNNLRDIEEDRSSGKNTLAVIFGATFTKFEYLFCILAASAIPIILARRNHTHSSVLISCFATIIAIPLIKTVFAWSDNAPLNQVLANTGKLLLLYSLSFSIGWMV